MRRFRLEYPNLLVWVDGNDGGPLIEWAKTCWNSRLQVVERTFAWLGQWRRLAKDFEQCPQTEESFIYIAMTGLMLNRLQT